MVVSASMVAIEVELNICDSLQFQTGVVCFSYCSFASFIKSNEGQSHRHKLIKNLIEGLWDYLDSQKQAKQPKSAEELWQVLQNAWNNLPADFLIKLPDSVPKRIDVILKAKGGHTKH